MSLSFRFELPLFRYQVWNNLVDNVLAPARDVLGYDSYTWNHPAPDGSNDIEGKDWVSLEASEQQGATDIGFTEETWDCWVNHYFFYDWSDLEDEGVAQYWGVLGWDKDSWDGDSGAPASDSFDWGGLSTEEQQAAINLCYFESTWDELELTNADFTLPTGTPMQAAPVVGLPTFPYDVPATRYVEWSQLPPDTFRSDLENILGYNEGSWNLPSIDGIAEGSNDIEIRTWEELTSVPLGKSEQQMASNIGFDEDKWDCFVNHYTSYSWDELIADSVVRHWGSLGWTEGSWEGDGAIPESDDKWWAELTGDEKDAAANLCYFEGTWNSWNLTDPNFQVP